MRLPPEIDALSVTEADLCVDLSDDGRKRLAAYLERFGQIHQNLLSRVLGTGGSAALLGEILEDIGNRYLDLADLMSEMGKIERAQRGLTNSGVARV